MKQDYRWSCPEEARLSLIMLSRTNSFLFGSNHKRQKRESTWYVCTRSGREKVHTYHVLSCSPCPYDSSSVRLSCFSSSFLDLAKPRRKILQPKRFGPSSLETYPYRLDLFINYPFLQLIKTHMSPSIVDENLTLINSVFSIASEWSLWISFGKLWLKM